MMLQGMALGAIRPGRGTAYKPSTFRAYESALARFVLPAFGDAPLTSIRRGDAQRLADQVAASHSPHLARQAVTALRVLFRCAQDWGDIDDSPLRGIRVPTAANSERVKRRMNTIEIGALLDAADLDDLGATRSPGGGAPRPARSFAGPIFSILVGCGLRTGELRALRWGPDGLDLADAHVVVTASADRAVRTEDGEYLVGTPKSIGSRRSVPMPADTLRRLRAHRLATGRPSDGALVFTDSAGRMLSPSGLLRDTFTRVCAAYR